MVKIVDGIKGALNRVPGNTDAPDDHVELYTVARDPKTGEYSVSSISVRRWGRTIEDAGATAHNSAMNGIHIEPWADPRLDAKERVVALQSEAIRQVDELRLMLMGLMDNTINTP